jgi:hypothetical protein
MEERRESRVRMWRGARDWKKCWQVHICDSHIYTSGNILSPDSGFVCPSAYLAVYKLPTVNMSKNALLTSTLSPLDLRGNTYSSRCSGPKHWNLTFPPKSYEAGNSVSTTSESIFSELLLFLYSPLSDLSHFFLFGCMLWPPPCSGCFSLFCCSLCSTKCWNHHYKSQLSSCHCSFQPTQCSHYTQSKSINF